MFAHVRRAQALGPNFDAATFAPQAGDDRAAPGRRRVLRMGIAATAAGLAAVVGGVVWSRIGHYRTALGEISMVPLSDGSSVTLNTSSRVAVDFTADRRGIELIEGEALFEVTKDPARPFVVEAGDTIVTAVGTSFTVTRMPDRPVQILVREGVVDVTRRAAPTVVAARVSANARAETAGNALVHTTKLPAGEVARVLAWRDGKLSFEDERLDQAAAEFARYSDTHIVIEDPSVAARTVTGAFSANNPVGFARATAKALGLHVEIDHGSVRLKP